MRSSGDLHHRTAVYFNVAQNGIPTGSDVCGLGVSANFPAIPSPQSTAAPGTCRGQMRLLPTVSKYSHLHLQLIPHTPIKCFPDLKGKFAKTDYTCTQKL